MLYVDKTNTENPFVDNVAYYAKLLALNSTVKINDEALACETKESKKAGDTYIACIEGTAKYEMFDSFPVSILQNYIPRGSNLDIYAKDPKWLKIRLESFPQPTRGNILERLSKLARTVYVDHYDIMTKYIKEVGSTWLEDHEALYQKCKSGEATYMDLFDEMPMKTSLRIIRAYLNLHGYMDLAILWDPNSSLTKLDLAKLESSLKASGESNTYDESIRKLLLDTDYVASSPGYNISQTNYMNQFLAYLNTRNDTEVIQSEIANINKAMRDVFISHYETMQDRYYFSKGNNDTIDFTDENGNTYSMPMWYGYYFDADTYKKCKAGTVSWEKLYQLFPDYHIREAVEKVFGTGTAEAYNLDNDQEALRLYIEHYAEDKTVQYEALSELMTNMYLSNYQFYLNSTVYYECINGSRTIYDIYEYLPNETLKSIINTEFPETNSLQIFATNKNMLNSFLGTLSVDETKRIKDAIAKEMMEWYPSHHVEKNNYYRAYLGLPPIDANGEVYEDTLVHSYNAEKDLFMEFGDTYVGQCPTDIYPASHWRNQLYTYDAYDISVMRDAGVIDSWVENGCKSNLFVDRYKYLRYLGDEKLDLYKMRKANNFDLIGVPNIDDLDIRNKFVEAYEINKEYVIRCVYADAYKFQSDYYDKFMVLFIVMNTMMDCINMIPDYIINRDVFDARCVQYMFESFGIPYYSDVPIKYQKAMLKNLNILIKYKSSTRNMVDICNLFGYNDVQIFGYYMMKHRKKDSSGNYIPEEDNDIDYALSDVYVQYSDGPITDITGRKFISLADYPFFNEDYFMKTVSVLNDDGSIEQKKIINNERAIFVYDAGLEQMIPLKDSTYFTKIRAKTEPAEIKFIKVPIGEALTEYKGDEENHYSYEEITDEETWDGGLDHDYLKQKILDYAFNAVRSKYISIDAMTNLTEIAFQTSYFYNMLFDNAYAEDLLTLEIPSLKSGHTFRLVDIIFFMFAMTYYYSGLKDKIMYSPTQILYIKGYNFQDIVNEVFNDPRFFSQTDSSGRALDNADKEEVFNINTEIAKRNYNYQETFTNAKLKIKGFNLNADIDALEKWLNDECQMSLEDFIVSDDEDGLLTIRQFYSLHNSYYQKNIFGGPMTPMAYNNLIKYAYGVDTIQKVSFKDIAHEVHYYLPETMTVDMEDRYGIVLDIIAAVAKNTKTKSYDQLLEKIKQVSSYDQLSNYAYLIRDFFVVEDETEYDNIIESLKKTYYSLIIEPDNVNEIFVLNSTIYGQRNSSYNRDILNIPVYNRYTKNADGNYDLDPIQYYHYDRESGVYSALISGLIYVKNKDGIFTFGTNAIYEQDENSNYIEIDYDAHTTYDEVAEAKILNFGDYFIKDDSGKWILDPNNCYVMVKVNGEWQYILLKDLDSYTSAYIGKDDCFVMDDNGHFVRFRYTDYYDRTHHDTANYNEMEYIERPLYVPVNYETEIYDQSLSEENRVYYKELNQYLTDAFAISTEKLYVLNPDGVYLPEDSLLNPSNTWYWDTLTDSYRLVIDDQFTYLEYEAPLNVLYIMVLYGNHDYYKYALDASAKRYMLVDNPSKRYVYNSDTHYVTVLNTTATYAETSQLIVVLNQELTTDEGISDDIGFNPSLTDGVWDENDWFYQGDGSDSENSFGMHGENVWYYRKPGSNSDGSEENTATSTALGSGFYLPSTSFIGSVEMEEGSEYYIALDILPNFSGQMQIVCTADDLYDISTGRVYEIEAGMTKHIEVTFIANQNSLPQLRFIKYNFDTNPIHVGDMVVVSNVKVAKSYSEHYIPTDIPNVSALADIYRTNTSIYKWLLTQMHNTSDKRMYDIYLKLYESLMVSEYNREAFKMPDGSYALTYTDFLRTRDSVLSNILDQLRSMEEDVMQSTIANYIIDICYSLTLYLSDLDLKYLYSYFPGMSVNFIQQYIYRVINWFKSWKVHLLGLNTVYRMGNGVITDENGRVLAEVDGDEFTVKILYDSKKHITSNIFLKDGFIKDTIAINPDGISPRGKPYEELYDFSDNHNYITDHIPLRDRIRIMVDYEDHLDYHDGQEMHLVLEDDTTKVNVSDSNDLTIRTINGDVFKASEGNNLVMSSDKNPQDVFASQILDEINLLSGDYIEQRKDSEEDDE